MKVKLELWKNGPNIIAPEHCPYRWWDSFAEGGANYKEAWVVHPSLCMLCKVCQFETCTDIEEIFKPAEFVTYLTLLNEKVASVINNQNYFLQKNDRIPLAILISAEVFDSMLKLVYNNNVESYQKVRAYFLTHEKPLCYILGCPVYLSTKLTKSKAMVVGEVEWK